MKNLEDREKDIQAICSGILDMQTRDGGDYPNYCPFCVRDGYDLSKMEHAPDCIYLIAKDLKTNL